MGGSQRSDHPDHDSEVGIGTTARVFAHQSVGLFPSPRFRVPGRPHHSGGVRASRQPARRLPVNQCAVAQFSRGIDTPTVADSARHAAGVSVACIHLAEGQGPIELPPTTLTAPVPWGGIWSPQPNARRNTTAAASTGAYPRNSQVSPSIPSRRSRRYHSSDSPRPVLW